MGLLVLKRAHQRIIPHLPAFAWLVTAGLVIGMLGGMVGGMVGGVLAPATEAFAADSLAIVANLDYPADHLTMDQVRDIYLGHKNIQEYLRIRPIDQSDPAIRTAFLRMVLDKSKESYIAWWQRLIFQEGGIPPLMKSTSGELIGELIRTDGAIGYVWLKEARQESEIKILLEIPGR